jgi:hypothetical protein
MVINLLLLKVQMLMKWFHILDIYKKDIKFDNV